jgi:antitoxin component YwqK of YwqJK toxin-antitoxin module
MRYLPLLFLIISGSCKQPVQSVVPNQYKSQNSITAVRGGITYVDGQPYNGWLYLLAPGTADTILLESYWKGKQQGLSKKWYAPGQLMEERYYEAGKKTGQHKGWWLNGQQRFLYHFAADEYEDLQEEWGPTGQRYRSMHYKAGHEEGLQQMWKADGKIVFNYEVKNGRAYGLTGTKNCTNVQKH